MGVPIIEASIALLESDPAVRSAVTLFLEFSGIQVVAGSTGSELASRIVARGIQPALIVADICAGANTAFDEVPVVLASMGHTPKVVVTSDDISPEMRSQIEANGWQFLIKPYPPEELLSHISGRPTSQPQGE